MAESKGRPKTLVRRHILEIKKDTRDWLEEQIEELKIAFVAGKGAGAIGEAVGGFLSNPLLAPLVMGGTLGILGGIVGKEGLQSVVSYFGSLQGLLNAQTPNERQVAGNDLIENLRRLINFFSPIDIPPPDLQPEGPQGGGGSGGGGG